MKPSRLPLNLITIAGACRLQEMVWKQVCGCADQPHIGLDLLSWNTICYMSVITSFLRWKHALKNTNLYSLWAALSCIFRCAILWESLGQTLRKIWCFENWRVMYLSWLYTSERTRKKEIKNQKTKETNLCIRSKQRCNRISSCCGWPVCSTPDEVVQGQGMARMTVRHSSSPCDT